MELLLARSATRFALLQIGRSENVQSFNNGRTACIGNRVSRFGRERRNAGSDGRFSGLGKFLQRRNGRTAKAWRNWRTTSRGWNPSRRGQTSGRRSQEPSGRSQTPSRRSQTASRRSQTASRTSKAVRLRPDVESPRSKLGTSRVQRGASPPVRARLQWPSPRPWERDPLWLRGRSGRGFANPTTGP